jgi:hypothetical protein
MSREDRETVERLENENPGTALVRLRWAKATPEQRAEQARKMMAGQGRFKKAKRAKRGKKK